MHVAGNGDLDPVRLSKIGTRLLAFPGTIGKIESLLFASEMPDPISRFLLTVLPHFGFANIAEQHIRVVIAQLSVLAQVKPEVAREIVLQRLESG